MALVIGALGNFFNEKIELAIWEETLSSELEFQLERSSADPSFVPHSRESLRTYQRPLSSNEASEVPNEFRSLSPGIHDEIEVGDKEFCVLVRDIESTRYFLVYDITELEETEHAWAKAAVIAISAIAFLVLLFSLHLGRWLVAPINDLAARVGALQPNELGVSLSFDYPQQEVRTIAGAIDRFILRLRAFIERERSFISMASHEFRTPLTVIAGAADVLTSHSDLPPHSKKPIERIKRAVLEMQEMIAALLYLAKEQSTDDHYQQEVFDVAELIPDLVESHHHLLRNKDVSLRVKSLNRTVVQAPKPLVAIVIANLIRNAVQYTLKGEVVIELCGGVLQVRDTGPGVPHELRIAQAEDRARVAGDAARGSGLGLYIIRNVAERFSWQFTLQDRSTGGTTALLEFGPSLLGEVSQSSYSTRATG